jgi:hypothetical protein
MIKIEFTKNTIKDMKRMNQLQRSGGIFNFTKNALNDGADEIIKNIEETLSGMVKNDPYYWQDKHYRGIVNNAQTDGKRAWEVKKDSRSMNEIYSVSVNPLPIKIKNKSGGEREVKYAEWVNYGHFLRDGSWWSGYFFIEKGIEKTKISPQYISHLKKGFIDDLEYYFKGKSGSTYSSLGSI